MDVAEAIKERKRVQAFNPTSVSLDVIRSTSQKLGRGPGRTSIQGQAVSLVRGWDENSARLPASVTRPGIECSPPGGVARGGPLALHRCSMRWWVDGDFG